MVFACVFTARIVTGLFYGVFRVQGTALYVDMKYQSLDMQCALCKLSLAEQY